VLFVDNAHAFFAYPEEEALADFENLSSLQVLDAMGMPGDLAIGKNSG
jgi:hypothetical protein